MLIIHVCTSLLYSKILFKYRISMYGTATPLQLESATDREHCCDRNLRVLTGVDGLLDI
jgi:hypothetical protein